MGKLTHNAKRGKKGQFARKYDTNLTTGIMVRLPVDILQKVRKNGGTEFVRSILIEHFNKD